jgi:hypothetical protein
MARNGCPSPPRSRRWFEMAARARPGASDGSKWPLEPAPEPENARRVLLEPAPEPQNARQVPLEPPRNRRMLDGCRSSLPWSRARACPGAAACSKSAARAPSREVRSFLAPRLEKCRCLLHMAARAWPGTATGSKWAQMVRNGRSSPPRSRRILDGCFSSMPRSRRMLDRCRSSHPGTAECSTGAARACPGAALELALEPQPAQKVPLEPTAVRCLRFLRLASRNAVICCIWPLEPGLEPQLA